MEIDSAGWVSHGVLTLVLVLVSFVLWRAGFFRRLLAIAEEMLLSNWQLALLGAAALALSLASGYTTFDGLRNFTSAPLLSVLVAFGIQGVMLIVAWLIGESFAAGLNRQAPRRERASAREALIGTSLGSVLIGLVFYWALSWSGAIGFTGGAGGRLHADWQRIADVTLFFLMGVVLLALVAFQARRGGDVVQPYVQSFRLIARNAVLWVMLLAAMSASVFFSFDSHFNAIFPADERKRAAESRALNEVAAIVADIGERARTAQVAESRRLFESDGWKAYDALLTRLASVARGAEADIAAVFTARMEERQRSIGEQQERIAGAERGRTALLRKRDELEAELQRLEPTIGALEAELAKAQTAYEETRQAIAAKRIEAAAEDGGVEGSLKRGKGSVWRQRAAELDELQRKIAVADEPRLKEAQRQRDLASARIVGLKRELATLAGEMAKYTGAIRTAEHRIKTAQALDDNGDVGRSEPIRVLAAFENALSDFRLKSDSERLAVIETQCASLVGALSATPAARETVRDVDCDLRPAAEAAARLFTLNAGLLAFEAACAGGARLPQAAGTDELLAFGRKCLQDSGLSSRETGNLGARLQAIEMNRDDKAHRFVVTWNAVLDGNRLAYLSLALAIGVDALVFTAGLFGAAAARSPLSDLAGPKARSAGELETIVRNALGRDRAGTADLVLAALRPASGDDARSEVDLASCDAGQAQRIRKVLVAGRSIGAVERAASEDGAERYLLRPELVEFLSAMAGSGGAPGSTHPSRTRLEAGKPSQALPPHRTAAPPMPPPEIEAEAAHPDSADLSPRRAGSADVPAPGRLLLTDGRPGGELSHEPEEGELRSHIREALLAAVASEATTAAAELRRHAGAGDLHTALGRIERETRRTLDRTVGTLAREHADSAQAQQLLGEARREIAQLVLPLMLQPELGLLDALIEEAEAGDHDGLPERLRALRDDIESMDRADASAWGHIARRIRHLTDGTPT